MSHSLLIALGGAAGALARHYVTQASFRWLGPVFPYGTLTVNVIGGLAIGLLVGWLAQAGRPDATSLRFFFGVGFLGAFTTMSAFSLEIVLMIREKAYGSALAYGAGALVLSVLAVMAGLAIARAVSGP